MTEKRVAFVTGASGPIGRSISSALAERYQRLVLVGRSREELERTAASVTEKGAEAAIVVTDFTDDLKAIDVPTRTDETLTWPIRPRFGP